MYFQQTSHKWRDIIGVARMSLLYAHARYREQQSIAIHSNPHTHTSQCSPVDTVRPSKRKPFLFRS